MNNKKTILITGASDGVGKATAIELAKQGHRIIIHGRSKTKTEQALLEIKSASGNEYIDMYLADFLSLNEVKKFADTIKSNYQNLDVLINNAGAQFSSKRELTVDGHEKTMVINVFAPMLLTYLLIDLLKKSAEGRVVTVSSASHSMTLGKPDLSDIELTKNYSMARAYSRSKLYVIWVMRHFIKEMKKQGVSNVTFNNVHPGSTRSNLARESMKSPVFRVVMFIWQIFLNSMEKGISGSIHTATSSEMNGINNKYFGPKGEEKVNEKYYSEQNEQKVWDYSMQIIRPFLKD